MSGSAWGYEVQELAAAAGVHRCGGQSCVRPASLWVQYVVCRGARLKVVAEQAMCGNCGPTRTRYYESGTGLRVVA